MNELPDSTAGGDDKATPTIESLKEEMDRAALATGTSNCEAACRALASMHTAAEKICALDPGPRCAAARARVIASAKRVHESCPQCELSGIPLDGPADARASTEAQAPPPEEPHRGCASCATTGGGVPHDVGLLLLIVATFRWVRGRKKCPRDRA